MSAHRCEVLVLGSVEVRKLLNDGLRTRGYAVLSAWPDHNALELIRWRRPRVVLIELDAPEGDGWQVLRELKADPDLAATTVIPMSRRAGPHPQDHGWVQAPFTFGDMLARIGRAASSR